MLDFPFARWFSVLQLWCFLSHPEFLSARLFVLHGCLAHLDYTLFGSPRFWVLVPGVLSIVWLVFKPLLVIQAMFRKESASAGV